MHKKLSLSSNLQSLHKYVVHKKVPNDILNALDIITYERTIIEEECVCRENAYRGYQILCV